MPQQESAVGGCLLQAPERLPGLSAGQKALLSPGPLCSLTLWSLQLEEMKWPKQNSPGIISRVLLLWGKDFCQSLCIFCGGDGLNTEWSRRPLRSGVMLPYFEPLLASGLYKCTKTMTLVLGECKQAPSQLCIAVLPNRLYFFLGVFPRWDDGCVL